MPSTCVFEFDRPQPIYYSGEVINGRVVLKTTSEKSVNEVYILFEGIAKVSWQEEKSRTVNGKTESYTEYYSGSETYLNTRTNVFGSGTLADGTHEYTFSIALPLQCPTSCEERFGKISYVLSLVVDRSWRFNNIFKQPLTVISTLNLNLHPEYAIPINNEDVKYFCCWPCSSGPVISTLTIPFGGYAPGQSIDFELEIDNQSSGYDLDGIELSLDQTYKFEAQTPRHKTRHRTNTLATHVQEDTVLRLSKRLFYGSLEIPSIPPTSQGNGIINVSYAITMAIKTGDCHTDSEIEIPITIGTIPLAQSARNASNADTWIPETPDAPQEDGYDLPPDYDNCKPPSFEEATSIGDKFIDKDDDEHNNIDGFVPKYPMYKNFALPSAPPSVPPSVPPSAPTATLSEEALYPPIVPYPPMAPMAPTDDSSAFPAQPQQPSNTTYGWHLPNK